MGNYRSLFFKIFSSTILLRDFITTTISSTFDRNNRTILVINRSFVFLDLFNLSFTNFSFVTLRWTITWIFTSSLHKYRFVKIRELFRATNAFFKSHLVASIRNKSWVSSTIVLFEHIWTLTHGSLFLMFGLRFFLCLRSRLLRLMIVRIISFF